MCEALSLGSSSSAEITVDSDLAETLRHVGTNQLRPESGGVDCEGQRRLALSCYFWRSCVRVF